MIGQLAMGTDSVKGNGRGLGETVGEIFLRELSLVEIDRRIRTLYGDEGLSRGCHDSHSFEFVRSDFAYNTRSPRELIFSTDLVLFPAVSVFLKIICVFRRY